MAMRSSVLIAVLVVFVGGCASARAPSTSTPLSVVENYLASLNRRDLLALTAYTTVDVEWYSVVEGERIQEVAGRDALAKSLTQFFDKYAAARWRVESSETVGGRVAVRERSEWSEGGRAQSRTTLGVYELSDGRIRRITYFLDGG
jgi:limonene-1,2-epoxide hydrolase